MTHAVVLLRFCYSCQCFSLSLKFSFSLCSRYYLFISACWEALLVPVFVRWDALLVPVFFVVTRFEVVGLYCGSSIWQVGHGGFAFDQCLAGRPTVVYASVLPLGYLLGQPGVRRGGAFWWCETKGTFQSVTFLVFVSFSN